MIFDTHAHFYGETLFRHLAARTAVPRVELRDGVRWMVTPTSAFPLRGGFVSLDERLRWMDAQGIDRQMITFAGALGPDVLPVGESLALVRAAVQAWRRAARGPGRTLALLLVLGALALDARFLTPTLPFRPSPGHHAASRRCQTAGCAEAVLLSRAGGQASHV